MENIILYVDCKGEALDRLQSGLQEKNKFFMGLKK